MDFLDVLWSIIIIYFLIAILFALFRVITDIFRDHGLSGGAKALWIVFLILFPLVGLIVYLITRHAGMTERNLAAQKQSEEEFASYVRSVAPARGAPRPRSPTRRRCSTRGPSPRTSSTP